MPLPEETARLVKEAAEEADLSVSAWLTRAAEREIAHNTNLAEVEAHVATLGISEEEWDEAEAVIARTLARGVRRRRREAS